MLQITLFADFVCPLSYLTESALGQLAAGEHQLSYRAFELFPESVPPGFRWWEALDWNRVLELADREEVRLEIPDFVPRTAKAHEATRFARAEDAEAAMRTALYAAYWSEGRDIGRIDVLQELAAELGLDPEALKLALSIDRFTDEVRGDREVVRRLRIPGTPTIYLGTGATARVVAGAHDSGQLQQLVRDVLHDISATELDDV